MRLALPASLAVAATLYAGAARADDEPRTPSLDWHVILAGSAGLLVPAGKLEGGLPERDVMGLGPGFGFELGFGFATRFTAGLWGQYAHLGAGTQCSACTTSTLGLGPFVGFHLEPGGRFDPWMTVGMGYRATSVGTTPDQEQRTWSGLELMRAQVGGDWYAFQKSGFGAFIEVDTGAFTKKTSGDIGTTASYTMLLVGGRFAFDTFGRDSW